MSRDPKKHQRQGKPGQGSSGHSGEESLPVAPKSGSRSGADAEPVAARRSTPIWLVILFGLLFYWAQIYIDQNAAAFHPQVHEPFPTYAALDALRPKSDDEAILARGKNVYEATCAPCHQPTGLGVAGQFPPLAGSEWVTTPGPGRAIRIALHGLSGPIEVKGQIWNNAMPAIGDGLSEPDLAAAISYIRNAWGHKGSVVKPDQIKAVKDKVGSRGLPWSGDELKGVPESE